MEEFLSLIPFVVCIVVPACWMWVWISNRSRKTSDALTRMEDRFSKDVKALTKSKRQMADNMDDMIRRLAYIEQRIAR